MRRCRYLTQDGRSLAGTPQNIWRLPTADEALRSMNRKPDKESPLWDKHSKVIYWWTGTEIDVDKAQVVVYDGKAHPRRKSSRLGYLAFRAVKNPTGS
jgi:hypothetical protein